MLRVSTTRGTGRTTQQLIMVGGMAMAGAYVVYRATSLDAAHALARYFVTLFEDAIEIRAGYVAFRQADRFPGSITFIGPERYHSSRGVSFFVDDHAVTERCPNPITTVVMGSARVAKSTPPTQP